MNEGTFTDQSILVTGSSRGLGLALMNALSARGANQIYAGCRTQEGFDFIVGLNLPNVTPVLYDVENSVHAKSLHKVVGSLDLLINNAGIASACTYTNSDALGIAKREMSIHYFGALSTVHHVLPLLRQSKSKHTGIINIASIAALSNFKVMGTYSASKAALHFLTQGLRAELKGDNIFVQGVYPGPFDTRLAAGYDGDKQSPDVIANTVLDAYSDREEQVFPDDFSKAMSKEFYQSPKALDAIFSSDF